MSTLPRLDIGHLYGAEVRAYFDADDEVYVQQIGPDMDGFFVSWEREVLLQLRQW